MARLTLEQVKERREAQREATRYRTAYKYLTAKYNLYPGVWEANGIQYLTDKLSAFAFDAGYHPCRKT